MLPKTVLTYLVLQSHFANQQLQNMSEKEKNELREKFSSLAKGQKNWKKSIKRLSILCYECEIEEKNWMIFDLSTSPQKIPRMALPKNCLAQVHLFSTFLHSAKKKSNFFWILNQTHKLVSNRYIHLNHHNFTNFFPPINFNQFRYFYRVDLWWGCRSNGCQPAKNRE